MPWRRGLVRIVCAPPDELHAPHRHDDVRLVVYLGGAMREDTFDADEDYVRGDFVFRPVFHGHGTKASAQGSRYTHLDVSRAAARAWAARHGWAGGRGRLDLESCDLVGRANVRGGGDDLLAQAVCVGPKRRAELIFANVRDDDAPLEHIACAINLAPYQLTRRFMRVFGVAPSAYRRQRRLQRAMAMLAESRGSLAAIAEEAGYHDQSHLSHSLKRETGLTPRAFRSASFT